MKWLLVVFMECLFVVVEIFGEYYCQMEVCVKKIELVNSIVEIVLVIQDVLLVICWMLLELVCNCDVLLVMKVKVEEVVVEVV